MSNDEYALTRLERNNCLKALSKN